jgi:hypothetical protein
LPFAVERHLVAMAMKRPRLGSFLVSGTGNGSLEKGDGQIQGRTTSSKERRTSMDSKDFGAEEYIAEVSVP